MFLTILSSVFHWSSVFFKDFEMFEIFSPLRGKNVWKKCLKFFRRFAAKMLEKKCLIFFAASRRIFLKKMLEKPIEIPKFLIFPKKKRSFHKGIDLKCLKTSKILNFTRSDWSFSLKILETFSTAASRRLKKVQLKKSLKNTGPYPGTIRAHWR